MSKKCTVVLRKQINIWLFDEDRKVSNEKKLQYGGNIFFEALTKRFSLTPKLIRRAREQQKFLWPMFISQQMKEDEPDESY